VINACRKSPKIIIARVQGKAVGGGVGLAAAADYCLATEAASIKLSELAIGIGPFVISPAVIRKVGLACILSAYYPCGGFPNSTMGHGKRAL
jgi:methylglutaconyl-CoA hydratase